MRMMKTPEFWQKKGATAALLLPLTLLWVLGTWIRARGARVYRSPVPVICVGNLTAGGNGKTPLVAWLHDQLVERGMRPAILSRGFGASERGPIWVQPARHDAATCGDEPLMLADGRDVMVSRDRAKGARSIASGGAHDVIVMDDGMQNPHIFRDVSLGVFDGASGIGNGWLIPAGPMRTRFSDGIDSLDAAVINGDDATGMTGRLGGRVSVFKAQMRADRGIIEELDGSPLLAFAGIAKPKRFFESVEAAGGNVVRQMSFADHHPYSGHDLSVIQQEAQRRGAELITTHKDWMRLPPEWREYVHVMRASIEIEDARGLLDFIETELKAKAPSSGKRA